MLLKNWWIKFGCFLTGYNYQIVNASSEVAAKAVKRYTAALLIVCIIWAFVGYGFTERYLEGSLFKCIAGSILAVIIIVQIEKQIILSVTPNKGLYIFRGLLALMMATLGAVIIDQIILKQDIELEKTGYVEKRVDGLLPGKTAELKKIIYALDTTIAQKEKQKNDLIEEVGRSPLIKSFATQTQTVPVTITSQDSSGQNKSEIKKVTTSNVTVSNIVNPKQALILPLDSTITDLRKQKSEKENTLLNIRPDLVKEISGKIGFLDELKVMYSLVTGSGVALAFWLLWFFFLLFLEMLVLFSKLGDKENDYEKTVLHQMNLQMQRLDVLAKRVQEN